MYTSHERVERDGFLVAYEGEVMSDEEAVGAYNSLPWIKAIVVNIDLPE